MEMRNGNEKSQQFSIPTITADYSKGEDLNEKPHQKARFPLLAQKKGVGQALKPFMAQASLQQFHNMSLNFLQQLCILLVLTIPTLQVNWQGTGNMSEANMTLVHNLLTPITSINDDFDDKAQSIAGSLNLVWDPAWNVIIVISAINYDSILYGYAFRDHWMWINGVQIPGSPSKAAAYVIWKDYNCQTWKKLAVITATASTFTGVQILPMLNFQFHNIMTDVWSDAYNFVKTLESHSALSSGAYSIVLSQDESSIFQGFICHVNGKYRKSSSLGYSDKKGAFFMFQTR